MKTRTTNESDVREEIAMPLLTQLGYKRGTNADIARELTLTYEREFLGRKKPNDPPLRGRADYVLTVVGAGRWVLEIKAPNEPIDQGTIEQALSYARHPEVAATYAVIFNGERLTVHHVLKASTEPPLVDEPISDPVFLAEKLSGLLSPASIRRDCCPPIVDLGKPLAEGLRSHAVIRGGYIRIGHFRSSCNFPVPEAQAKAFAEMNRKLSGFRSTVTGGTVGRDGGSRIRAKLTWSMPKDELLQFALDKKLMDVEYLALSDKISADPETPTVFDMISEVEVKKGETLYDITRWDTQQAGFDMNMKYTGRATGFLKDNIFEGSYTAQYYCSIPAFPGIQIDMDVEGTFCVELDAR